MPQELPRSNEHSEQSHSMLSTFALSALEPFQQSYKGFSQLTQKAGVDLPDWHEANVQHNSIVAIAGRATGSLAEFFLLSSAVGKVTGIGRLSPLSSVRGEVIKMGLTGGTLGLLEPVKDDQPFLWNKVISTTEGAASMAAFGATSARLSNWGVLGRPGYRTLLGEGITGAAAGTMGGVVGAEVDAFGHHGRPATFSEIGTTAAANAALGFGFAGMNRLVFGRIQVNLESDSAASPPKMSTEQWVQQADTTKSDMRSPIFTYIAEKRPDLRPANYESLREQVWNGKLDELSLWDWAPPQRPAVIQALRRMSSTELSTDANLDAFIGRINSPAMKEGFTEFADANRVEMGTEGAVNEVHSFMPRSRFQGESQKIADELSSKMQLPPATIYNFFGTTSGQQIMSSIYLGTGSEASLSSRYAERYLHEFNHHRQGVFAGKEPLLYFAKYPLFKFQQALGLREELPLMQSPKGRDEFLNEYVGSSKEKESFSLGVLARIRALMHGMPEGS